MGKRLLHCIINNSCTWLSQWGVPWITASLAEDGSGAGKGQVIHRQVPARKTEVSELEVSTALAL